MQFFNSIFLVNMLLCVMRIWSYAQSPCNLRNIRNKFIIIIIIIIIIILLQRYFKSFSSCNASAKRFL